MRTYKIIVCSECGHLLEREYDEGHMWPQPDCAKDCGRYRNGNVMDYVSPPGEKEITVAEVDGDGRIVAS